MDSANQSTATLTYPDTDSRSANTYENYYRNHKLHARKITENYKDHNLDRASF